MKESQQGDLVPGSAPPPVVLAVLAGSMAAAFFLMPRIAASAPFLALPLNLAGLFSALPLLVARVAGRFSHATAALAVATLLISIVDSPENAVGFAVLFGLWALVAGEVVVRRKSVIAGCTAGFVVVASEALLVFALEGTAPIETTLAAPQVQAAFDQWATQAALDPTEAKTTIDGIRAGIVALYPSLSVISAATIVAMNAVALGRLAPRLRPASLPQNELHTLRWPLALVVAFVASGALLLAPALQSVAWNGLVVTLFLFLLQGLSVLSFFVARLFASDLMRTLLVVASLLGPWAFFLSLLGLFDQWFDFRSRLASVDAPPAPRNL